jgi:hypothetical protein
MPENDDICISIIVVNIADTGRNCRKRSGQPFSKKTISEPKIY